MVSVDMVGWWQGLRNNAEWLFLNLHYDEREMAPQMLQLGD